ncbi:hypothetical protein IU485_12185 [Nocardia cyriacigeorgica]|nr:hypothetical protein [Nocardia cyriacigeorgica]
MVTVTVTPAGADWLVAFSEYDGDLLEVLKSNVRYRKWDPKKREWRVSADIAFLCSKFEEGGAKVAMAGGQRAAGTDGPNTAVHADFADVAGWRQKCEALDLAAKSMLAEVMRLQEDLDQLQQENQQLKERLTKEAGRAPVSGSWAEQLFHAVGRDRRDNVYRALSKILHPDVQTGSKVLMQQLNDARNG